MSRGWGSAMADEGVITTVVIIGHDPVPVGPGTTPPPPPPVGPTPPPPTPGPGGSVTVDASWSAIVAAMEDTSIQEVVVRDGTIGSRNLAGIARPSNNPVYVRAENRWGVHVSGWGGEGISINDGSCYWTLDGFAFSNANAAQGGCIVFGGQPSNWDACHHINLLNMKIEPSVVGPELPGSTNGATAHGLYIGAANDPGHHDIIADGWVADAGQNGLAAVFHMFHSSAGRPNGNNIVFRNASVSGFAQAIIIWDSTVFAVTIGPGVRIYSSNPTAVRHEYGQCVLDDVVSSGTSGTALVNNGSGMTINPNCSFN